MAVKVLWKLRKEIFLESERLGLYFAHAQPKGGV